MSTESTVFHGAGMQEKEIAGGELVQVDRIDQPVTIYNTSIREQWEKTGFYCSREATSMESRRKLWNAKMSMANHTDRLLSPHGVEVVDIILCPAVFKDEDGKRVAGAKMVLIDSKGECVNVTSRVFIENLLGFFDLCGGLPLREPLRVRMNKPAGKRYYVPELLECQPAIE